MKIVKSTVSTLAGLPDSLRACTRGANASCYLATRVWPPDTAERTVFPSRERMLVAFPWFAKSFERQPVTVTSSPVFSEYLVQPALSSALGLPNSKSQLVISSESPVHFQIKMGMRVQPLELGNRTAQRDGLRGVVLCCERVMCQKRCGKYTKG
jgi:hypothetical protein